MLRVGTTQKMKLLQSGLCRGNTLTRKVTCEKPSQPSLR